MKLIVISPPMSLKNEPQMASKMIQTGLQHFHLRKPSSSLHDLEDYIQKLGTAERGRVVLHSRHELAARWKLKVSIFHFWLPNMPNSLISSKLSSPSDFTKYDGKKNTKGLSALPHARLQARHKVLEGALHGSGMKETLTYLQNGTGHTLHSQR